MQIILFGYKGYWGQKLAKAIKSLGHTVRGIEREDDLDNLGGVAVLATPPDTHYSLAMKCMKAGLDVLVEKPMAMSHGQAVVMADYAKKNGIVLAVDSTFLHTAAFEYLRKIGKSLLSYQSIRVAPPMPQAKIPAGWDLIVHDLSIIQGLAGLSGTGVGIEDGSVAQCAFELPSGGSAFIFASRDWPVKERSITLHYPGEMYLWRLDGLYQCFPEGKPIPIAAEREEPLQKVIKDFVSRCENRQLTGVTDGLHGAEVIGCLERLFPKHSSLRLGERAVGGRLHSLSTVQPLRV